MTTSTNFRLGQFDHFGHSSAVFHGAPQRALYVQLHRSFGAKVAEDHAAVRYETPFACLTSAKVSQIRLGRKTIRDNANCTLPRLASR